MAHLQNSRSGISQCRGCPESVAEYIPEPVRSSLRPPRTFQGWISFFTSKLPILQWLWSYKIEYLPADIIGGITVAIVAVPMGLAYALLANLPPIYGLYASFLPPLLYAFLGTSRHHSVGTFAVVLLLLGDSIEEVFQEHESLHNCSVSQTDGNTSKEVVFYGKVTNCEAVKVDVVVTVAFLSGLMMIVMNLFRLGFVTIFLSEPMVSGYNTGAALLVFTSQLQHITGLEDIIRVPQRIFRMPRTWIAMLKNISSINWATLIISCLAILFLIIFTIANHYLRHPKLRVPVMVYKQREGKCVKKKFQWPFPIPSQLIVVIVAATISYFVSLQDRYGVKLVGNVPKGFPAVTLPNVNLMGALLTDAVVVSIITFSVTVSVGRVIAHEFEYKIDSNQELLALGLLNFISSFFSCFSTSGGFSRINVLAYSGSKTQLANILCPLIVLVVMLKLGPLFEPLPEAILGSIVWVALYGSLRKVKEIHKYFKLSAWDGVVWVIAFLSTALLGVEYGLVIGVSSSLLALLLRLVLPPSSALWHEFGAFPDMENFEELESSPGVVQFRFPAPLCSVNSINFRRQLEILCDLRPHTPSFQQGSLCRACFGRNATYSAVDNSTAEREKVTASDVHQTIIIDFSPVTFIDFMGLKTLKETIDDFRKTGVVILLAHVPENVQTCLIKSHFFKEYEEDWLFQSKQEACSQAQANSGKDI